MLYYTLPQPLEFAAMLLAGAAMGAVSLAFTYLRRLMRAGFVISLACDLFVGLLWAIIACLSLTIACHGRARVFHFLGMALGCALFLAAMSPLMRMITTFFKKRATAAAARLSKTRLVRVLLK